ncbi:MAG: 2,3-diphosphoglycerate-dependent phosphoglycerate mutase [Clostridiales bacterium]|jgi:2,3-bisphosphoglycerate-dependent phosphoglycerate mutase|nr:2,3-diphosphoglycerate-dependent phosphoglycerate mutase [Clostridiales bacterium]
MKLVLLRHGESIWNKENRFTGWTDVDLSEAGVSEAKWAGDALSINNIDFDVCYTSYLKRAIHTLNIVLERLDRQWLPVYKTWKLNERHYGALQGLNKADTAVEFGEEQVKIWRRSFDVQPPALVETDARNPRFCVQYRDETTSVMPLTESLKDTITRTVPYFDTVIKKDMEKGKRVIISAHGNSLRALVKYLDHISDKDIIDVNIPTGVPLIYEFDENLSVTNKYYLADETVLNKKN